MEGHGTAQDKEIFLMLDRPLGAIWQTVNTQTQYNSSKTS